MKRPTPCKSHISDQFIEHLILIHNAFYRQRTMPLPINQFGTLIILYYEEQPLSINELSLQFKVSKQQMSTIIDKLVQGGYANKERSSADRRCTCITISDKGRAVIDGHQAITRHMFNERIQRMNPQDVETLADSLRQFNTFLKKMPSISD